MVNHQEKQFNSTSNLSGTLMLFQYPNKYMYIWTINWEMFSLFKLRRSNQKFIGMAHCPVYTISKKAFPFFPFVCLPFSLYLFRHYVKKEFQFFHVSAAYMCCAVQQIHFCHSQGLSSVCVEYLCTRYGAND